MFEQGENMFKFDLNSGYHHVNIWPEYYKFLVFCWDKNGEVNYYDSTVLPFELVYTLLPLHQANKATDTILAWQGVKSYYLLR